MNLEQKIEGLLFYKGEGMTIRKIAELFSTSNEEVENALSALSTTLQSRGVAIIRNGDEVMMTVAKDLSGFIETMRKDEITKELSKASLETLSIVLYKNGVTRSEIDYIRGVNSSFILRNLLVRGLVQKESDAKDIRRMIYRPTLDTLSYMGVTRIEDLPNYQATVDALNGVLRNENPND